MNLDNGPKFDDPNAAKEFTCAICLDIISQAVQVLLFDILSLQYKYPYIVINLAPRRAYILREMY